MGNIYLTLGSYFHKMNSGRNNNKTAALVNWVIFQHMQARLLMISKHMRVKWRGFPMCAKKKGKKEPRGWKRLSWVQNNLLGLYTSRIQPTETLGKVFTTLWECTVEGGVDHLLISSSCFFFSGVRVCVRACLCVCQAASQSEPGQRSLTTEGVIERLSGHFPP